MVGAVPAHRSPGLPRDAQDHERDSEADDGVGDWCSECHDDRRGDHRQAHVCVRLGVVPVGDERGAVESATGAQADASCNVVARIPECTGRREHGQVGWGGWMDEALHGLDAGHARTDKDGRDDGQTGASLGKVGVERERDSERNRGECVAEVVDQVGEQRDAAGGKEDRRLSYRRKTQKSKRKRDGMDALAGALDAVVDESVGVIVIAVVVLERMTVRLRLQVGHALGPAQGQSKVTMRSGVRMAVNAGAVPVSVGIGSYRHIYDHRFKVAQGALVDWTFR